MGKVDCIVLGGGNLVTGKGKRSNILKGSEEINNKKLGLYLLELLNKKRDQINNIVYVGDDLSEEINGNINYSTSSPGKGFIKSLKIGVDTLKSIKEIKSKITLVICGDLPLVGEDDLRFILNNKPVGDDYLTIFGVDNSKLQEEYPTFNKNKRCLELEEQDFIFGNTFLVKTKDLEEGLERVLDIDNNGLEFKSIIKFLSKNLGLFNFILGLKLIIFGNIKFFDGKIPHFLKKMKKPNEGELIGLLENAIGKEGIKLVNNSPSKLVIDYDRLYQKGFFEKILKE